MTDCTFVGGESRCLADVVAILPGGIALCGYHLHAYNEAMRAIHSESARLAAKRGPGKKGKP